ncbi:hypothetical protein [Candidatus Thiodiazotropha sp. CDECU1]|uniref:hypothetical protein n=1 Tax=Candidatus Thiodiazotropha sp. CDECU1 TaxID=3065865 RepID=UPI00292E9BF7|nr:hypothetical protein [Candidatus Thiodiazotropha sp. CDECU1]
MNMIVCEGTITQLADGSPACSTGWQQQIATIPFDIAQIDPAIATAYFVSGFVVFIVPWGMAWGLSQLLHFIRRS